MDTRHKIIGREALPPGGYLYVSGYFDPLLATHARRLNELREGHPGGLVVVVRDPAMPILPARARAELVAALKCVDHVIIGGDAIVDDTEAHAAITAELIEHVAQRHAR